MEIFSKYLWSALQTHLQGVDRATLATMAEKRRHRAALLSRLSGNKIARPAKASKQDRRASLLQLMSIMSKTISLAVVVRILWRNQPYWPRAFLRSRSGRRIFRCNNGVPNPA
jgi:hypothetical protein